LRIFENGTEGDLREAIKLEGKWLQKQNNVALTNHLVYYWNEKKDVWLARLEKQETCKALIRNFMEWDSLVKLVCKRIIKTDLRKSDYGDVNCIIRLTIRSTDIMALHNCWLLCIEREGK